MSWTWFDFFGKCQLRPFNLPFLYSTYKSRIFKIFTKLRNLIQNIQRISGLDRKEQVWTTLDCHVHFFVNVAHHKMFIKINLLQNCIKELETCLRSFPAIHNNKCDFFVWSCRQFMNVGFVIDVILCLLHVSRHTKMYDHVIIFSKV